MRKSYLLILISIFLVTWPSLSLAGMSQDEAISRFDAAGAAYKEGDYAKAIEAYESILIDGTESGALYYNLANSYQKSGQSGKAVLNYERALRLIPRDSDVKFNLQYVRSFARAQTKMDLNFLERLVEGHIQFYTREEMAIIITVLGLTLAFLFLISLYFNWPDQLKQGILGFLAAAFIIYAGGFVFKLQSEKDLAIILTGPTKSYFEPSLDSTVHFSLNEGTKVKVVQEKSPWVKIKRLDAKLGWIEASATETIAK